MWQAIYGTSLWGSALCVTCPKCPRVRSITSPLRTKPAVSQSPYVTVDSSNYVQVSLCHSNVLIVHHALVSQSPYVTVDSSNYVQGSLCHSNVLFVHPALCVTIPICHGRQLSTHRFFCVTVTFSLCTMPVVLHGLIRHKVRFVICQIFRVGIGVGIPFSI